MYHTSPRILIRQSEVIFRVYRTVTVMTSGENTLPSPRSSSYRMYLRLTFAGIPAPKTLRGLRERPVRHTTVLDREEMLPFVLEKAQEKKWF